MTTEFTPARIAELRALAEKATKGPWRQHLVDDTVVIDATGEVIAETFPDGGVDDDIDFATDTEQREANAAFIAAADPPTLTAALDEIERLRGLAWIAWREFNAIRARSGAPLALDGMTTVSESWWSEMTDTFAKVIGEDARKPWPSPNAKAIMGRGEELERLRAENESMRNRLAHIADHVIPNALIAVGDEQSKSNLLRAENASLREALKPFARLRRIFGGREPDNHPGMPDSHGYNVSWAMEDSGRCDLTLGQFRRARRALEGDYSGTDYTQPALPVTGAPSVTHKGGDA